MFFYAFLDLLANTDENIDMLDIKTLARMFSKKADILYCYLLDVYLKL